MGNFGISNHSTPILLGYQAMHPGQKMVLFRVMPSPASQASKLTPRGRDPHCSSEIHQEVTITVGSWGF